jgi:hypothetical protein
VPLAARYFATVFFPSHPATQYVVETGLTSPFAATFAVPLDMETSGEISRQTNPGDVSLLIGYVIFTPVFNQALLVAMVWLFQKRWRVSLT